MNRSTSSHTGNGRVFHSRLERSGGNQCEERELSWDKRQILKIYELRVFEQKQRHECASRMGDSKGQVCETPWNQTGPEKSRRGRVNNSVILN